jgi:hypothetical protein
MAESFNLNTFLNEQATYNSKQYTAVENGRAAMEAREIARAEEAVAQSGFLGLTLSEKLNELGVGKRVVQQIGDTAVDAVASIVSPITEYLAKYEHVYDQNIFNSELQKYGKQMFFANQALTREAVDGVGSAIGQNFVYDM